MGHPPVTRCTDCCLCRPASRRCPYQNRKDPTCQPEETARNPPGLKRIWLSSLTPGSLTTQTQNPLLVKLAILMPARVHRKYGFRRSNEPSGWGNFYSVWIGFSSPGNRVTVVRRGGTTFYLSAVWARTGFHLRTRLRWTSTPDLRSGSSPVGTQAGSQKETPSTEVPRRVPRKTRDLLGTLLKLKRSRAIGITPDLKF